MSQPLVSIIIPNRNSRVIDQTLASLFAQSAFDRIKEILVIGVDEPGLVVETCPVQFISTQEAVSAPVARNIGIRRATGDYLAFIDADCIAEPSWLASLLGASDPSHQVIGGSVRLSPVPFLRLCYNLTMFHDFLPGLPPGTRSNLGTLNLLISRQVMDRVGLLDEALTRCQDTEWTLRMRQHGYVLFFEPLAVVQHQPAVSGLSQILRLWYHTGFFSRQIRQKYHGLISLPPFHRFPFLLVLFSPVIATLVTIRIYLRDFRLSKYIHAFPVVFLTKVAWCLGASRRSVGL